MTKLTTVLALDAAVYYIILATPLHNRECQACSTLTIARLWASPTVVTILVTVTALDLGHVLGFGALVRPVTFLVTVTADHLLGLRTIASRVSFLAAVEASSRAAAAAASLRAVSREMTRCDEPVRVSHLGKS
ncbi:hypothetical protein F4824DRAFT_256754 [Ustulina deusta]|nr:hypothetical protein F4824DRAFT_256754 [Ustulina deusta]